MYGRNNKKLVMFALSCAAIVLGIYMTFFYRAEEKSGNEGMVQEMETEQKTDARRNGGQEKQEESMNRNEYNYADTELPLEENESADETYNGGKVETEVYFSNTERLDTGSMPLEAQKVLCSEVQQYLRQSGYADVTELYLDDESYAEDAQKISFVCFMDGHKEMLQVEYYFTEHTLRYHIVESEEYGVGEENE